MLCNVSLQLFEEKRHATMDCFLKEKQPAFSKGIHDTYPHTSQYTGYAQQQTQNAVKCLFSQIGWNKGINQMWENTLRVLCTQCINGTSNRDVYLSIFLNLLKNVDKLGIEDLRVVWLIKLSACVHCNLHILCIKHKVSSVQSIKDGSLWKQLSMVITVHTVDPT